MTHRATLLVQGMSCDHCATLISEEIELLPGVTGVTVDLGTGLVTVTGDRELDTEEIRTAVDEAGYTLGSS